MTLYHGSYLEVKSPGSGHRPASPCCIMDHIWKLSRQLRNLVAKGLILVMVFI